MNLNYRQHRSQKISRYDNVENHPIQRSAKYKEIYDYYKNPFIENRVKLQKLQEFVQNLVESGYTFQNVKTNFNIEYIPDKKEFQLQQKDQKELIQMKIEDNLGDLSGLSDGEDLISDSDDENNNSHSNKSHNSFPLNQNIDNNYDKIIDTVQEAKRQQEEQQQNINKVQQTRKKRGRGAPRKADRLKHWKQIEKEEKRIENMKNQNQTPVVEEKSLVVDQGSFFDDTVKITKKPEALQKKKDDFNFFSEEEDGDEEDQEKKKNEQQQQQEKKDKQGIQNEDIGNNQIEQEKEMEEKKVNIEQNNSQYSTNQQDQQQQPQNKTVTKGKRTRRKKNTGNQQDNENIDKKRKIQNSDSEKNSQNDLIEEQQQIKKKRTRRKKEDKNIENEKNIANLEQQSSTQDTNDGILQEEKEQPTQKQRRTRKKKTLGQDQNSQQKLQKLRECKSDYQKLLELLKNEKQMKYNTINLKVFLTVNQCKDLNLKQN